MTTAPIRLVEDPDELIDWYEKHAEVHLYGLGDLDEPHWSRSQWYRQRDAVVGIIPLPGPPEITAVYAVSAVQESPTTRLLLELEPQLPPQALITAPIGATKWMSELRGVHGFGIHLKLHLPQADQLREAPNVRELGDEDLPALAGLYERNAGEAFFLPSMLDPGLWAGVEVDGELVAAGGTHLLSQVRRVAALGGILTDAGSRGRGYGAQITSWLADTLFNRGVRVGLNVQSENYDARSVYRKLGFVQVHEFEEFELR